MKLQQVLILFATCTAAILAISTGKLTKEENQERLENCGRDAKNTVFPGKWLCASRNRGANQTYSSAIRISSRHFFTFSQTLINEDMEWRHNKSHFKYKCGENDTHLKIPRNVLRQNLEFLPLRCLDEVDCQYPKINVARAFLLDFCDYYYDNQDVLLYFPMIVEVETSLEGDVPCLAGGPRDVKIGDSVHSYRVFMEPRVEHDILTVENINDFGIGTELLSNETDIGGPLMMNIDEKWTVVGYSGSYNRLRAGEGSPSFYRMFQSMYWLQKGICQLTGICSTAPSNTEMTNAPVPFLTVSGTRKDEKPIDYEEYGEIKDPENVTSIWEDEQENGASLEIELFVILLAFGGIIN